MNEPFSPDPRHPDGREQFAPTRDVPAQPQDPRRYEALRGDTERFEPRPPAHEARPPQPYTPPQQHTQQYNPQQHTPPQYAPQPYGPLAHEGGFAYGNPPAPPMPYPPQDQFIPAHLQVPNPYAPPMYQQPFMYPQQMPPMQQTVYVNGGGKRVNHALHLILTILTAGLWLPVWIILAIANS